METKVPKRALERAIDLFGEQAVSERIGVPVERMRWWCNGSVPVPHRAFLQLVDLLLERSLTDLKHEIHSQASARHPGDDRSH
jgi:hypothetical protein